MILTWTLQTAPAQAPEYWLLFVDGNAWCSLENQAPYAGAGQYSVDLTKLDSNVEIIDGQPHAFSVALVGGGAVGPQSAAVSTTVPASVIPVAVQPPCAGLARRNYGSRGPGSAGIKLKGRPLNMTNHVYQDAGLHYPFPTNSAGQHVITADADGKFPEFFMDQE